MSLTSILEDALEDARKESEQQGKLRPPYAALCKINSELKQQLHAAERRARRWEAFARKTWAKKLTPDAERALLVLEREVLALRQNSPKTPALERAEAVLEATNDCLMQANCDPDEVEHVITSHADTLPEHYRELARHTAAALDAIQKWDRIQELLNLEDS